MSKLSNSKKKKLKKKILAIFMAQKQKFEFNFFIEKKNFLRRQIIKFQVLIIFKINFSSFKTQKKKIIILLIFPAKNKLVILLNAVAGRLV